MNDNRMNEGGESGQSSHHADEQSMREMGLPLNFATPKSNRPIPTGPSGSNWRGGGGGGGGGRGNNNNGRGRGGNNRGFFQRNHDTNRNHPYQSNHSRGGRQNAFPSSNKHSNGNIDQPSNATPLFRPSFTDPNPWAHLE